MPARALTILLAILSIAAAPVGPPGPRAGGQMRKYEGRYYLIHTDLAGDDLREAELRMARMAEEYHQRTRDFAGAVQSKFPFFLYGDEADYYTAGGKEGTAGFFDKNNNILVAIAGRPITDYTWTVVQHEGFHQFAANVIGGELPIWVNEGLAEYFGEGIFTGDGFVTGVIPPQRLERVKKQIASKSFRPIKQMMLLAHRDWNQQLAMENYDQAWSMVQFLAHAEDGRYASAFVSFMRAIGKGVQWQKAWQDAFGSAEGFEQRWRNYWSKLPANPTVDLYARAVLETLTSVLARSAAAGRQFETFDAFADSVKSGKVHLDGVAWLPPDLVNDAFNTAGRMSAGGYTLELVPAAGNKPAALVLTLKDRRKMIGRFTLKGKAVLDVIVDVPER